jgi:hypothetical protein
MPYTKVTPDQFEWDENALRHKPTGARFSWYPSGAPSSVNWGRAGDVLLTGEDFDRDEIRAAAMKIGETKAGTK